MTAGDRGYVDNATSSQDLHSTSCLAAYQESGAKVNVQNIIPLSNVDTVNRLPVIDSPWVSGVLEYLQAQHARQYLVLMTATPQEEIQDVLETLEISQFFREVHGAPILKVATVHDVLKRVQCAAGQALVVGDSETDLNAAKANNVPFLLRRTALNKAVQERHSGPICDNFIF